MKITRIILKIIGITALLLLLVAVGSFTYVYFNKAAILAKIKSAMEQEVNGTILVRDADFSFFRYFPATSVLLSDVSIRDSLYENHQRELLSAKSIYVKINLKDLFSSQVTLEKLTVEDGSFYMFTDSSGYTNKYMLQREQKNAGMHTNLEQIKMSRMQLTYRDYKKNKFFSLYVEELNGESKDHNDRISLNLKSNGTSRLLSFNLLKGYYARNASYSTSIEATWWKDRKLLELDESEIYFNRHRYYIAGSFALIAEPSFKLHLGSPELDYTAATNILPGRIKSILSKYNFTEPVKVNVMLEGKLKYQSIPKVTVELICTENEFYYGDFRFDAASFTAAFRNFANADLPCSDENSIVEIRNFKASWESVPLSSTAITVINFKKPVVIADVKSEFPLSAISKLSGSTLYNFSSGNGNMELVITARPDSGKMNMSVDGNLKIRNGEVRYGPRSMPFNNIQADILFAGRDVIIRQLNCKTGSSNLSLQGDAREILTLVDHLPGESRLKWTVTSSFMDMNDFAAFIGRRKKTSALADQSKLNAAETRLDQYLEKCVLDMDLNIASLKYNRFRASRVSGNMKMDNNTWNINDVKFQHAGGHISLTGSLSETSPVTNAVSVNARLDNVDISRLFSAFGNFSQKSVTDKQIEGRLNAIARLAFTMNDKAALNQSSLKGDVELMLKDGALKGFQPLGKLMQKIFRKRDFTNIRFSDLSNQFKVNGNEIFFERMKINSSVMELYVEGSYYLTGKTDLNIQVPLSNLKQRDWDEIEDNLRDKGQKGINVYIHAVSDDKGEVQFKYQPLMKLKKKQ